MLHLEINKEPAPPPRESDLRLLGRTVAEFSRTNAPVTSVVQLDFTFSEDTPGRLHEALEREYLDRFAESLALPVTIQEVGIALGTTIPHVPLRPGSRYFYSRALRPESSVCLVMARLIHELNACYTVPGETVFADLYLSSPLTTVLTLRSYDFLRSLHGEL